MAEKITMSQLSVAASWLYANEGEGAEREACHAVAAWIEDEIARRENNRSVRAISKETGASESDIRRRMRALV